MEVLTPQILTDVIVPRPLDSHKGTFGRVLLIGGNRQFGGAIIMATQAAVASGAGLVTVATDPSNRTALLTRLPEAMTIDYHHDDLVMQQLSSADVVVIGPGLGTDAIALHLLQLTLRLIQPQQRLIIDGSALTLLAEHQLPINHQQTVYTPHQMEWQRLSQLPINQQTEVTNAQAKAKFPGIVVVKKHHSEIYTSQGNYQLPIGTPAQATGGMGDTLAGIIGGLTAQFTRDFTQTVLAAVYLHSAVAEQLATTNYVVLPTTISEALPAFMHQISTAPNN